MQCCALTDDRRRCQRETMASSAYCADHQHVAERVERTRTMMHSPGAAVGTILGRWRGGTVRPMVPDDARYDPPEWLRKTSTPDLCDQLLHNPDSLVRWSAAFLLRKRRAVEGIEPLWHALGHDPVRFVRQQAAVAFGKIGTVAVFAPLVEALYHDADQAVRQACAVALGNLGYSAAVQELIRVLERDDNTFVRWDCIIALGQLADRTVEPLLTRVQQQEREFVVRHACNDALREIQRRHPPVRATRSNGH